LAAWPRRPGHLRADRRLHDRCELICADVPKVLQALYQIVKKAPTRSRGISGGEVLALRVPDKLLAVTDEMIE
jgi:hypothetical protein